MVKSFRRFYEVKDGKPVKDKNGILNGQQLIEYENKWGQKHITALLNWVDGYLETDWINGIPAVQMDDGHIEHWTKGKLNNNKRDEDGNLQPAIISQYGEITEYWIDGKKIEPHAMEN